MTDALDISIRMKQKRGLTMSLYESETLTVAQIDQMVRTHTCSCGANLTKAWGGATGHNCFMLRCAANVKHSEFVRPFAMNQYNTPGYNMPGVIRSKEKQMMQKYGEEKTKQLVRIGGGSPIATLTQKGAAQMLTILYPEAAKSPSGQAAIIKGSLICRDYGLNPAMDHIFLIPFEHKEKRNNVWVVTRIDWSVVRGIKASRLICGREKSYGYIDNTPRIMKPAEQEEIFGEVDTDNIVTICKLKDKDGNVFPGYGKWPKDRDPQGLNKGNTKFNMSTIRAERQSLDKLNPGAMPADVDVIDERFVESPKVTADVINPEAKQIGQPGDESQIGEEDGQQQDDDTGEPPTVAKPPVADSVKQEKGADNVDSWPALEAACKKDFKLEPAAIYEMFGGKSARDLTISPVEVYDRIKLARKAK
jgi:hypothetical protein